MVVTCRTTRPHHATTAALHMRQGRKRLHLSINPTHGHNPACPPSLPPVCPKMPANRWQGRYPALGLHKARYRPPNRLHSPCCRGCSSSRSAAGCVRWGPAHWPPSPAIQNRRGDATRGDQAQPSTVAEWWRDPQPPQRGRVKQTRTVGATVQASGGIIAHRACLRVVSGGGAQGCCHERLSGHGRI